MTVEADSITRALREVCRDVREGEPLAKHVSFRIGGPADVLAVPRSVDELAAVAAFLFRRGLHFVVIGAGSNVLIADSGIAGIAVKIGKGIDRFEIDGETLTAQSGAGLPHLARAAADAGLGGLEFAAGIPATVGGAAVMNAGAHGHAMEEIVEGVEIVDASGRRILSRDELGYAYRTSRLQQSEAVVLALTLRLQAGNPAEIRARTDASGRRILSRDELGYAYRTSRLQQSEAVVLAVTLRLQAGNPAEIRARTDAWLRRRSESQPIGPPSSGCVFQNPAGDHAGRLIDLAGGKGLAVGGARVSEVHANYIINTGRATAADVVALADKVKTLVAEKFGITLEPEIKLLGEFSLPGKTNHIP